MKMGGCGIQEEFIDECKIVFEGVEASVLLGGVGPMDGLKWRQG